MDSRHFGEETFGYPRIKNLPSCVPSGLKPNQRAPTVKPISAPTVEPRNKSWAGIYENIRSPNAALGACKALFVEYYEVESTNLSHLVPWYL